MSGDSGDGGAALAAQMSGPYGVAFDNVSRKLFITDAIKNVVRAVNTNTTGVATVTAANNVRIFPNPSNGTVTIELPTSTEGQLQLIDVTGRTVKTMTISGQATIKDIPAGNYFVKVSCGNDIYHSKLTILE